MAKIAIKYENIVPYGGIFYVMDEFKRTGLDKLADRSLGLRCLSYGHQYSDIMLALFCISTMEDNTVFLLFTAMLRNFYQHLLSKVCRIFPGIDMKSRLKRFIISFIVISAKRVRAARQWKLMFYTKNRWLHYWSIFNKTSQ